MRTGRRAAGTIPGRSRNFLLFAIQFNPTMGFYLLLIQPVNRRLLLGSRAAGQSVRLSPKLQIGPKYSYCCLCILIVRPCILYVVYVFLLLSMYSYCCLCILIVRPCILYVVYVFLLLSMYTFCIRVPRRGYPD
jgi:hypothetical protein